MVSCLSHLVNKLDINICNTTLCSCVAVCYDSEHVRLYNMVQYDILHYTSLRELSCIIQETHAIARKTTLTLVSVNVRFVWMFAGVFPEEGASVDSGLIENFGFQYFRYYIFGTLRSKTNIII